jgi:hypothetical protein
MSEAYVTQEEFKRLEARVLMVEHEVEGEKLLSALYSVSVSPEWR